jgi:transposase
MSRRQLTRREKKDIVKRRASGQSLKRLSSDYDRSKQTIINVVRRHAQTGGDLTRQAKLSRQQKKAIVALVETDPTIRLARIRELLVLTVSCMTISRYLCKKGYPCEDSGTSSSSSSSRKTPHRLRAQRVDIQ